ncbi:PIR Superfamily Protein [Plasmodium ovale curtisi]|uniref:PIR Superfamily Protein n=1 Tax=Plasmodium ovale curtisi TaxID=864141 RepID=A0A1A8WM31_PLAOA|nr:PIR Superfamily Protein [Plasmodium ovale curtisi]
MSATESDIYSFFNDYKTYKQYEAEMEKMYSDNTHNSKCYSFLSNDRKFGAENANNICVKFKIFCKVIESKKKEASNIFIDYKDFAYINYWLNSMSKNASISNKLTVKEFQDTMSDIEDDLFAYGTLSQKLYDIKDEDFNNMNLLRHLYYNHGQIFKNTIGIKEIIPCIEYFQEYINTYKKGIIMCPHDDTSFCKALKHFKKEYEENFFGEFGITEKCSDKEFLKLPTYNDISLEDKKITIVGSILGPSFTTLFASVFLYMFTPFGQWVRAKIRTNKESRNNIYEENDSSLLSTLDNNNMNFDENPYHISYNSLGNL